MTTTGEWESRTWSPPLADPIYRAQVMDRIKASVVVSSSGCWEWQKWLSPDGYGHISVKRRMTSAHQVMFAIQRGGLWSRDLQIDHLCRNRACCNPAHLELVTPRENTHRGRAPAVARDRQTSKTECARRHPYDEKNTYRNPVTGHRICRRCRTDCERRRRLRELHAASTDRRAA